MSNHSDGDYRLLPTFWRTIFQASARPHVVLQYGKPILLNELSKDEKKQLAALAQNRVKEMLKDNRKYL